MITLADYLLDQLFEINRVLGDVDSLGTDEFLEKGK